MNVYVRVDCSKVGILRDFINITSGNVKSEPLSPCFFNLLNWFRYFTLNFEFRWTEFSYTRREIRCTDIVVCVL